MHTLERGGMGVQYVYDAEGKKTGVIVPIDLWNTLSAGKPADKQIGIPNPGKCRGIYRDLEVEVQSLRDEWNRL